MGARAEYVIAEGALAAIREPNGIGKKSVEGRVATVVKVEIYSAIMQH